VAAGLGYKSPESFNGLPHLGEHLHDGSELLADVNWVTAGAVNIRANVDRAGHFPPLLALRELGSSPLPTPT